MANNRTKKNNNRPNFWGMMQNVLIASLNKGQFLIGLIGFIFIIMVVKLTPDATKLLLDSIINKFGDFYYIGWILGIFSTFGWYLGTKRTRQIHHGEMKRVAEEKKNLQQNATKKKLRSSN